MSPLNADLSVYAKPRLRIVIFVDDLLITSSSTSEIKTAKAAFQARFQMSDLGLCQFHLGIKVTSNCEKQILRLGQLAYLEKILLDHQMMDCKPSHLPIETQHLKVAITDYELEKQFRTHYQSAVQ